MRVTQVSFADAAGNVRDTFQTGEDVVVLIKYHVTRRVEHPHFVLSISDAQGGPPLFLASMLVDGNAPVFLTGEGVVGCRFKSVPLRPRAYQVWGEVWGADRARLLVSWQRLGAFRIVSDIGGQSTEVGRGGIRHLRADAPISVPYEWAYKIEEKQHTSSQRDHSHL
jgi:hypothetical protein